MRLYLDASAAVKLAVDESETAALMTYLDEAPDHVVISSVLLETEMRRAVPSPEGQAEVSAALSGIELLDASRELFRSAGLLPMPGLRSLDAIHLATAMHFDASVLVAYDRRLLRAAETVGLPTATPA